MAWHLLHGHVHIFDTLCRKT